VATVSRVGDHCRAQEAFPPSIRCHHIETLFAANETLLGLPIVEGVRPVGLVMREKLFMRLATEFGYSLFRKRPISAIMDKQPLIAHADETMEAVAQEAMERPHSAIYDHIIVSGDGGGYCGVLTVRDLLEHITEQKLRRAAEHAAELAHANLKLERSNEDLEQFAYIVSHDLQEPLRKVTAFGGLLRTRASDALDETCRDYLDRMTNAATRMQRLILDLLEFSRVSTHGHAFQPVELRPLIMEVLGDLEKRLADSGGAVIVENLPTIHADALQMQQLFQNLIGNALKFARPGAVPEVRVASHRLDNQNLEITVSDNGIGFDEKYLDKIFLPFQRLHSRDEYEGTGIGLAICRKIAIRHGGTLSARSQVGQGATFVIRLPTQPRMSDAPGGAEADAAEIREK
jgi:signal transduction histidine kinase